MKKSKIKEVLKEAMMPLFIKSLRWHHQDLHAEMEKIKTELVEIKELVKERCA